MLKSRLEYNGVTKTLDQWSDETGISKGTIASRLRAGRTPAQALGKVPQPHEIRMQKKADQIAAQQKQKKPIIDGVSDSIAGHARRLNIPYYRISSRVRNGYTVEEAFEYEVWSNSVAERIRTRGKPPARHNK